MSVDCKGRVLVVEDQPRYRVELEKLLQVLGYVVKSAQGEEQELLDSARRTVREFRPHVTIMDLELLTRSHRDDRSGLALIDDPDFAFTRCVVYSAHLGPGHALTRDLKDKTNVDDVMARHEVDRLVEAVRKSFKHGCACRSEFVVRWPAAWDVGRITEAVFGADSGVPPDVVVDVLGRLFPDGVKPLRLSPLYGAAMGAAVERSRSVLLEASLPTKSQWPSAIKLAPRDRISTEVAAYERHIDQSLGGGYYVESRGSAPFWDVGAIRYSFVGAPQQPLKSLSAFYRQEADPASILKPLRHFFGEAWRPHYADSRSRLEDTLFDAYDRVRGLRKLFDELRPEGGTVLPGLPPGVPDPVAWVIGNEADSGTFTAYGAITHGDLHGDNLFVEADHAWAIDFEQSGPGPILRDFVELECDIVTRLMPPDGGDDAEEYFRLALALTTPRTAREAVRMPDQPRPSADSKKAAEVVSGLRAIAADVTGFKDMREYYWGLLLVSLLSSSNARGDWPQRGRAMLLAAVAAGRLEHWHEHWPPGWARRWPGPDRGDEADAPAPRAEPQRPAASYDAFLSYNRDDLAIVQPLVEQLRAAGVGVWYDRDLDPGESWLSVLEDRPQQSRVCLVCYGPTGLSDWQKTEQDYVLMHRIAQKTILVPVLLPGGGAAEDVRGFAGMSQVCDLRRGLGDSEDEIQKLIRVILAAR